MCYYEVLSGGSTGCDFESLYITGLRSALDAEQRRAEETPLYLLVRQFKCGSVKQVIKSSVW